MKTTANLLRAVIMTVFTAFCCSIGNAQISYSNALVGATLIYSNAFNGSGAVNITNTPANYEAGILGGSGNTNWIESLAGDTNALYANGVMGTPQGNAWLLPFVVQSGQVYTLNASVNFAGNPGSWVGAGFTTYHTNGIVGNGRFNTGGVDFGILTESTANVQAFAGPNAASGFAGVNGAWSPATGVHTLTMILDTTATKWVCACFVDGVQANTNFPYASNPTILGVGLSQNGGFPGYSQNTFTWTSFILSATPLVITKQPVSANVAAGVAFTNTVVVSATAPFYQWFSNGVPIVGATTNALILNPVTAANAGVNYYVVITNNLGGAATSAPVSLTVYVAPAILAAYPVTYTNLTTFYGATNVGGTNYLGSTPKFSVSAIGQAPLTYQWQTNGVAVGGATNVSFTFTNCPLNGPTNFACVVTNSAGSATNTWLVSYLQSPMSPFPQTIMSNSPVGFWRLNEGPDDGNGDNGVNALDYAGGNNGIYTNAVLGYAGYTNVGSVLYNNTDPSDASVRFNFAGAHSDVFGIQGIDFATNGASATFTVQAWAKGSASQVNGACIIAKGYNGGEQFALDVNGNKWRFLYRNASGGVPAVTASTGPDNSWHFIVGVVDQVNGNISLYVDGLVVASAAVTPGSGVFPVANLITIGARGTSPADIDSAQFDGYLSDVVVYNHALTSGQVANLWITAGGSTGFTFAPPLPPTNFVFQANGTITIPATVFGPAPMGYYWTNVTIGGIVGSGRTNIFGNMNATLIISNAPASLSGDLLELVVTNATSSTNWFTTLFSPQPPITLDYSNSILYSNYFNGGLWSIGGMPLTAANILVGGTNTMWTDPLGINNTGKLQANGVSANTSGDSWLLPFTPHAGYVYTVTTSVTLAGNPGSWVGLGFAQTVATNATGNAAMNQGAVNGYAWEILTSGTANLQAFQGPAGVGQCVNVNSFYPVPPATYTNTVVLDATGPLWTAAFYVDGVLGGTTNYASTPPISAVGITQNALTIPGNIQWNYFSFTQVAPGGVPPYLLAPLPPTSILLTNATVTIPATAFGSAPLGYYWSNNSTIIASGLTNNMAPLPANLSVPSSSLSAGQLELVVTNAYGTNITLITLVSSVNPNPGTIQFSVTGNQLTMGWPTNLGWTLQAQTNDLSTGLGTNWVNVPGSTTVTNVVVPISPANGSVFYRLHN